jgi:hypothetical protein
VSYHSRPSLVVSSWLSLKIGSLLVVESPAKAIRYTRWLVGYSLQGAVLRDSINNVLARCGLQCLFVRLTDRLDGRVLHMLVVARNAGRVVWSFVMVPYESRVVESVDDIGALEVLLSKMRSTVSNLLIMTESIKRPVGHVSRVSLLKRTAACEATAVVLSRRGLAELGGEG